MLFRSKMGVHRPTARRVSQTVVGGPSSVIPGGFGVADIAAMHPAGFMATLPLQASEMGHSMAQGDYGGALMAAAMSNPGFRAAKGAYDKLKVIPMGAARLAARNPRIVGGLGAGSAAGLNAQDE